MADRIEVDGLLGKLTLQYVETPSCRKAQLPCKDLAGCPCKYF